ncbi:ATP-dependent helicase [Rhizobium leguminosarum bv. viciae]|uniref:DEAD/DEAH box helicase n=1 Tax=Rhizobium leguminosarum TaxID=384 RepID=UPI0014414A61|nr:DEAD/DEAH box helicase [Rhizobium leguminosarum]NKK00619.1 ATP-dependent helicase [Rhizobium leguminosarum bv. viciae]
MKLSLSTSPGAIVLTVKDQSASLLHRLVRRSSKADLQYLSAEERPLAYAIADLRAAADGLDEPLSIDSDRIVMSHRIAASISGEAGELLGLPPFVDMILKTDVEGIVGSSSFRLRYEWSRNGQRQLPHRTGAILDTAQGTRRLPLWMLDAIEIADSYHSGQGDATDWEALGRFRKALDPGASGIDGDEASRISMTDFLSGLEVRLVDRFSISPGGESDFDVVPFSGDTLDMHGVTSGFAEASESMSEVGGPDLQRFQSLVRGRGALPAYRLSPGRYVVVERSAASALSVMADMQKAAPDERRAFIQNPLPKLTEAIEAELRRSGKLDGLSPEAEQEAIEAAIGPVLVETQEFSERVTGIVKYEKPDLGEFEQSSTTWLPEEFAGRLAEALGRQDAAQLQALRERVAEAIEMQKPTVEFEDLVLPARAEMLKLLDDKLEKIDSRAAEKGDEVDVEKAGPFVLETEVNYEEVKWHAALKPRTSKVPDDLSDTVRTSLKSHQVESLAWQIQAWRSGLPGVLNADEQGLGKTLQTISFLAWLKTSIARPEAKNRGPVLVVAPTSLLENWEQEVSRHMDEQGLGHLIRLYGSSLGGRKLTGARGTDTESGEAKLDFGALHEAVAEGRAHRFWLLTTYTTLTNYQHSFARIPFSAVVFDEIQALKNPISLRAVAARSVNADFRIGLTGTPIENSTVDLWAVMDQLAAGSLDSLKEFRQRYLKPEEGNMAELYARVFERRGSVPPLAIRRLKETVATDLPVKSRFIHPRLMPDLQALAYDDARLKLARGGLGAQLKMLHHIRSVSVHPSLDAKMSNDDFEYSSGRLHATMEILRRVKANDERALVFIEHRKMQYRFIELVRSELGLGRVDLINGETPISQRQAIVNRFQRHLSEDQGFDLLVLGPKAAGTGLTLTAATHVIHLSRWWNPAVEEQCNDRVHRIGQTRPVTVHVPMAVHEGYREQSFDCLLQSLMMRKRRLASSALWPMGDVDDDVAALQRGMASERLQAEADPVGKAVAAMFDRDELVVPTREPDGSYAFH